MNRSWRLFTLGALIGLSVLVLAQAPVQAQYYRPMFRPGRPIPPQALVMARPPLVPYTNPFMSAPPIGSRSQTAAYQIYLRNQTVGYNDYLQMQRMAYNNYLRMQMVRDYIYWNSPGHYYGPGTSAGDNAYGNTSYNSAADANANGNNSP